MSISVSYSHHREQKPLAEGKPKLGRAVTELIGTGAVLGVFGLVFAVMCAVGCIFPILPIIFFAVATAFLLTAGVVHICDIAKQKSKDKESQQNKLNQKVVDAHAAHARSTPFFSGKKM